jgi:hypothetical protein
MNCEPPEAPQFTQAQKEEFSKLALDFLVRNNFQKSISTIEIEIRLKPPISEEFFEETDGFTVQLYIGGCKRGRSNDPDDPCPPGWHWT